jgi:hypothetical protein
LFKEEVYIGARYGSAISLAHPSEEGREYFTRSNDFYLSSLRLEGGGVQHPVATSSLKRISGRIFLKLDFKEKNLETLTFLLKKQLKKLETINVRP